MLEKLTSTPLMLERTLKVLFVHFLTYVRIPLLLRFLSVTLPAEVASFEILRCPRAGEHLANLKKFLHLFTGC